MIVLQTWESDDGIIILLGAICKCKSHRVIIVNLDLVPDFQGMKTLMKNNILGSKCTVGVWVILGQLLEPEPVPVCIKIVV